MSSKSSPSSVLSLSYPQEGPEGCGSEAEVQEVSRADA